MGFYLGIDFGTSNSSLSLVVDDPRDPEPKLPRVEDLKIAVDPDFVQQSNRVPTATALVKTGRSAARRLVGWDLWRTFFGRQAPKVPLLRRGQNLFLSVKSDLGAERAYPHACTTKWNTPEKVATTILQHLLKSAREKHDIPIRTCQVVVTVPASLNAAARRQTKQAAVDAGFHPDNVELIDEPIAALLDLLNSSRAATILEPGALKQLLVFDYGGGTLDLCLARCRLDPATPSGLQAENLAISTYRRNGGNDIDCAVMEEVVWPQVLTQMKCQREEIPLDLQRRIEDTLTWTVARDLKELVCKKVAAAIKNGRTWAQVERMTDRVTTQVHTDFKDEALPKSLKTARYAITVPEFSQVMEPFLEVPTGPSKDWPSRFPRSLMLPVFETLEKANVSASHLDYLVLHGGSCRNPWVRNILQGRLAAAGTLFEHVRVIETPDLDTSVSRGAALACYWRHGRNQEIVPPITGEGIGILPLEGKYVQILAAGEHLPYPKIGTEEVFEKFHVPQAEQKELIVPFCTGNSQRISGIVKVPLPPGTAQGAAVKIKFRVDCNKVLEWWYNVNGGEFQPAGSVEDPWTATELTPSMRRVIDIRRRVREQVLKDQPFRERQEREETDPGQWHTSAGCRALELSEMYALHRAGALKEVELLALESIAREGLTADLANMLSLVYWSQNRKTLEMQYAREAVRLNPQHPVLLANLGYALAGAGNLNEAASALRQAVGMDENLAFAYEKLGDVCRAQADEPAARREYEQAIRLYEARAVQNDLEALSALGSLYHKIGKYGKCEEARANHEEAWLNAQFQGDHRHRIAVFEPHKQELES